MDVMIAEAEEIAMIQPLQGEAYLIIRGDLGDGENIAVKLSARVCKQVQSYLATIGTHIDIAELFNPLSRPLN